MFSTTYEFGYSWFIAYGLAIPLALAGALAAVAVWRGWPRWLSILAAAVMVWAIVGLFLVNVIFGINKPMQLPTERFLTSGRGRVLDVGADPAGRPSACCSLDPGQPSPGSTSIKATWASRTTRPNGS